MENPFVPEAVDEETRVFNERLEALLSTAPPFHTKTPREIREAQERGEVWPGRITRLENGEDRVVSSPAGGVPVRVFVPEDVRGVYLHVHGGGFSMGRPYHNDILLDDTARKCSVAVVSVDYRLAPEDRYPAGADDCEAVAAWLAKNALAEFGSDRLVIGGESAGANLSAVTLARMRDRQGFTGFRAANLVYGCYDVGMTPSQRNWGDRELIISTPTIEWINSYYLPENVDPRDPDVSPLYGDLSGMPPALFTVGTLDPLLDDTLFMHARWQAAGNQAELAVYPGGTHLFNFFPIKLARTANERIQDFIRGS